MDLFTLPIEIRLKIYSELLVHHEPIEIWDPEWDGVHPKGFNFCTALLRVNKQVHSEAISLLYSSNRFGFSFPCDAVAAIFVRQIGEDHANLIRYVCLGFPVPPTATTRHAIGTTHQEEGLRCLDILQGACSSITTLELFLPSHCAYSVLRDSAAFSQSLDLIHTRLERFRSLREVRVEVVLEDGGSDDESGDDEEGLFQYEESGDNGEGVSEDDESGDDGEGVSEDDEGGDDGEGVSEDDEGGDDGEGVSEDDDSGDDGEGVSEDDEQDDGEGVSEDDEQDDSHDDRMKAVEDSLRQLESRGWVVSITRIRLELSLRRLRKHLQQCGLSSWA